MRRKAHHLLLVVAAAAPLAGACASGPAPDPSALVGKVPAEAPAALVPDDAGVRLIIAPEFDCRTTRSDEAAAQEALETPVPPPPFSPGIFPCTRCHNKPDDFNTTPRTLTVQHSMIKLVHGPRAQWCYDCHNPSDRDKLRLAGGRLVPFTESYQLCGQCHGEKLRDWKKGIHGRRTGCWNGKREYLLCVYCHSPHSPHFAPIKPEPRPLKPDEIQLGHAQENAHE